MRILDSSQPAVNDIQFTLYVHWFQLWFTRCSMYRMAVYGTTRHVGFLREGQSLKFLRWGSGRFTVALMKFRAWVWWSKVDGSTSTIAYYSKPATAFWVFCGGLTNKRINCWPASVPGIWLNIPAYWLIFDWVEKNYCINNLDEIYHPKIKDAFCSAGKSRVNGTGYASRKNCVGPWSVL